MLKYRIFRWWHDLLPQWLAYRLPKRVAYWAAIRVGVHATTGEYSNQIVPELMFMETLERWEKKSDRRSDSEAPTEMRGE